MEILNGFSFIIYYILGGTNILADALSDTYSDESLSMKCVRSKYVGDDGAGPQIHLPDNGYLLTNLQSGSLIN